VIGVDNRIQIQNTRDYPWSAIALVRVYWSAADQVGTSCTGWMIGANALATAAHCIYLDGYADRAVIKPAVNTDDVEELPYGSCMAVAGEVPPAWISTQNVAYDYGVYWLDCAVGLATGVLPFKVNEGNPIHSMVQLTGYPREKPGRTMWTALGVILAEDPKGIYYDLDMSAGQSGAPVWAVGDLSCAYCVIAMNSCAFSGSTENFGARIDREAYDFLQKGTYLQPASAHVLEELSSFNPMEP
jgi:V8-like Glu-specific endopeptidase